MTIDHGNQFSVNNELLFDVTQFMSQLNNSMLSMNENSNLEDNCWIEAFNETLREELNSYKVFDC